MSATVGPSTLQFADGDKIGPFDNDSIKYTIESSQAAVNVGGGGNSIIFDRSSYVQGLSLQLLLDGKIFLQEQSYVNYAGHFTVTWPGGVSSLDITSRVSSWTDDFGDSLRVMLAHEGLGEITTYWTDDTAKTLTLYAWNTTANNQTTSATPSYGTKTRVMLLYGG